MTGEQRATLGVSCVFPQLSLVLCSSQQLGTALSPGGGSGSAPALWLEGAGVELEHGVTARQSRGC